MDNVTISVIIPFYGDPSPTESLIAALQDPDSRYLHEIIVSDDCSPTPFPATSGVHVVRRRTNGGFAQAVNSGAEAATGSHLLILNSDLELTPGFLDGLVEQALPWMPAVVAAPLVDPHGRHSWSGRHFPTITHQVAEWLLPLVRIRHLPALHEVVGHDTKATGTHDEAVDWVVGALMLIPRDAYAAVGGMDEDFYMNCEEVDLQRRLRALGLPSVVLGGGITAMHEGGGSSDSAKRIGWVMDGRKRYARKWNGPWGERVLEAAMLTATGINLGWNLARRAAGTSVRPIAALREQTGLVLHPESHVPEANRRRDGRPGPRRP